MSLCKTIQWLQTFRLLSYKDCCVCNTVVYLNHCHGYWNLWCTFCRHCSMTVVMSVFIIVIIVVVAAIINTVNWVAVFITAGCIPVRCLRGGGFWGVRRNQRGALWKSQGNSVCLGCNYHGCFQVLFMVTSIVSYHDCSKLFQECISVIDRYQHADHLSKAFWKLSLALVQHGLFAWYK